MEHQDITEEVLLHFKRFPEEKQDQIRSLVNYSTLMGLTGKDLISIGGKLNRIDQKREIMFNRNTVESMDIRPINKDKDCRTRWAYRDGMGVLYHFEIAGYYRTVKVTNIQTKKVGKVYVNDNYDFGRYSFKNNRELPTVMLNVFHGKIRLP